MPTYIFHTEETVAHQHELDIELPVDMGASNERLTDRMARTAAENRLIDGIGMPDEEKIVAVFREDGEQIWPRKRTRKSVDKKAIDEINAALAIAPALDEGDEE